MMYHTPRGNQGQMVEVSYASDDDGSGIIKRVFDRSDGEETFFSISWDDFYDLGNDASDSEPWNHEPDVPDHAWRKVRAPRRASTMPRTLTASDRRSLIRLASSMPVGSDERKAILKGLAKTKARMA